MSTPEPGRFRAFGQLVGHYRSQLVGGAYALFLINDFLPPGSWWSDIVFLLTLPAIVIVVTAMLADLWFHSGRLCERCMGDTPLNGPQQAGQRRSLLWLYHILRGPAGVILMFTCLGGLIGLGRHYTIWHTALDVATLCLLIGLQASSLVHRKLLPWCTWCHWGDGGDDGGDEQIVPDGPPGYSKDHPVPTA